MIVVDRSVDPLLQAICYAVNFDFVRDGKATDQRLSLGSFDSLGEHPVFTHEVTCVAAWRAQ